MTDAPNGAGGVSRFASNLLDILDRVSFRRVPPDVQYDPVYRLRYEAYRREGFVLENADELVRDEFDDQPNVYCYGIYIDDEMVSSVRFHYLTPEYRMSPSYSVFKDVLDPMLDQGMTILDPGRFTADHAATLAYPALPFLTLRVPTMAVGHFKVDYCLSSVRPEHAAFYKRIYQSRPLATERYYHGLSFPMVLLACKRTEMYEATLVRFPFFRSTPEECAALFEAGSSSGNQMLRSMHRQATAHLQAAIEPDLVS